MTTVANQGKDGGGDAKPDHWQAENITFTSFARCFRRPQHDFVGFPEEFILLLAEAVEEDGISGKDGGFAAIETRRSHHLHRCPSTPPYQRTFYPVIHHLPYNKIQNDAYWCGQYECGHENRCNHGRCAALAQNV